MTNPDHEDNPLEMNEQERLAWFTAQLKAIELSQQGGEGMASSAAAAKPDASPCSKISCKSPSAISVSRPAAIAILALLEEAAACLDMFNDASPSSDESVEELIIALCDTSESISDALKL
jgi:hypothetical protein